MELFDVVNEKREPLGYTLERGKELKANEYNVGIELWLFNNNKLLMTQRSIKKSHPGKWEVPGGCSQTGETSKDTLIREAKEEINLTLNNGDYELIDTQIHKKQFVDMYKSNKIIDFENIILQEEEVSNIGFFTKDEFLKMAKDDNIVKAVYDRYINIKNKFENDW